MSSVSVDTEITPEGAPQNGGFLDQTLRPQGWDEYVGQEALKRNVGVLIEAARERNHPPEHLLFYGPPGLGKTTLAHLIARELKAQMKQTSGPAIEKVGDLAALLTNLSSGDILFIDEIHRLPKAIEEVLYPAMESGVLDIIIGKGPSARTVQLPLPPFTLIAATTQLAQVSSPLRSRFSGGVFHLEFYSKEDIAKILTRSAKILGIDAAKEAIDEIARRSRATPRTANYLLKRARDVAQLKRSDLTRELVDEALSMLEIDELGLTPADRRILDALIVRFKGGPVGVGAIAASLGEEPSAISDVHEPYLLQLGLIERTPRGRTATRAAYVHMKKSPPLESPSQNTLT